MTPPDAESIFESLGSVPHLLTQSIQDRTVKTRIRKDFSDIGYPINEMTIEEKSVPGVPLAAPMISVQEADLECPTLQLSMSQGMFTAFSLIVIIEHILSKNEPSTIIVDDVGEGLDYSRASKLLDLLFEKVRDSEVQLFATSNNRFLVNAADLKHLNILERKGHVVTSYNYANSKKRFDEFELIGLSNFDFFSRRIYAEQPDD